MDFDDKPQQMTYREKWRKSDDRIEKRALKEQKNAEEWKASPKLHGLDEKVGTRVDIDFKTELQCLHLHGLKYTRPGLKPIVNNIYAEKYWVKRTSPYLYSGEKTPDYFNLRYF